VKETVRECLASYKYTVDGKPVAEDIRVQYYSLTIHEMKAYRKDLEERIAENPEAVIWMSETLAPRLHALPDLTDEKGKPFAITIENLEKIPLENLDAIKTAIDEDLAGKSRPAKSAAG
jgi:hypothetical protein